MSVSVTGHDAPGVEPGDVIIAVNPRYFRPAEVETLLGDPTKAHESGLEPEITLREMVSEMVANDLEAGEKHSAEISRLRRGDRAGVVSVE
ncbi:GDP-mannose 4,6-dehydratase [Shigella flexneri]